MHPQKAKILAQLLEVAEMKDQMLSEGLAVVRAPERYGWSGSLLTASVMLPLTALGAVINDFSIIMVSRTPDATWEKAFPQGPAS
jgi:hypothetical protein